MGKNRGGKNRVKKNFVDDVSGSEPPENGENSCVTVEDDALQHEEGDFRIVADYLRAIQPEIDRFVEEIRFLRPGQAVTGLQGTNCILERSLLLKQFTRSIKGHEVAVFRNQRGSKIFEKILFLLDHIIIDALNSEKDDPKCIDGAEDASAVPSEDDDDAPFGARQSIGFLKAMLTTYSHHAVDNVTHLYGSHSGQSLLACFPAAIAFEVSHGGSNDGTLTAQETFAYFMGTLRQQNCLHHVLLNSSGSHVLRTALLALHGYAATKTSRTTQCRTVREAKRVSDDSTSASLKMNLPESRHHCSPSDASLDVFNSFVSTIVEGISCNPSTYALDPYASPLLQLILQLCHTDMERFKDLHQRMLALFLPSSPAEVDSLLDSLDHLLDSPAGSRFLESLLEQASSAHIYTFVWFYLKKGERLQHVALSSFGNYVLQKLVTLSTLKAPELKAIIDELDFAEIIRSKRHGIIWKLSDGCRRVRSHYKLVFTKHLEALNATSSSYFPLLWFAVILTMPPEQVKQLEQQQQQPVTADDDVETTTTPPITNKRKPTFLPDFIGCSILSSFLKFPASAIQPLLQAAKSFTLPEHLDWLYDLATSRQGSWLFQTIFDPYSPVDAKIRARLVRTLLPKLIDLAFHPSGSFVVSSAFRGCAADVRRQIAEQLKDKASELKASNYSLFRALDMKTFLENQETWDNNKQKQGKVYTLFQDILAPAESKPPTDSQDRAKRKEKKRSVSATAGDSGLAVQRDSSKSKRRKRP